MESSRIIYRSKILYCVQVYRGTLVQFEVQIDQVVKRTSVEDRSEVAAPVRVLAVPLEQNEFFFSIVFYDCNQNFTAIFGHGWKRLAKFGEQRPLASEVIVKQKKCDRHTLKFAVELN